MPLFFNLFIETRYGVTVYFCRRLAASTFYTVITYGEVMIRPCPVHSYSWCLNVWCCRWSNCPCG